MKVQPGRWDQRDRQDRPSAQGERGPQGLAGAEGPQGEQGEQGERGEPEFAGVAQFTLIDVTLGSDNYDTDDGRYIVNDERYETIWYIGPR